MEPDLSLISVASPGSISIDVIIPAFNSSGSIHRTLKSVRNQSYKNWNCYIIDDGSTDDTVSIAEGYSAMDSRITVLSRSTQKKGANSCRNLGCQNSTSNYLVFLDSDDVLLTHCLEDRVKAILFSPEADFFVFQTEMIDENGILIKRFPCQEQKNEELIILFVQHKIQWHTMSTVWSRSFFSKIGGWNEEYLRLQDVELNIRALLHTPVVRFVPGKSDTLYTLVPLNLLKTQAALYGIQNLMKDYFMLMVNGGIFESKTSARIRQAFVDLAFFAVRLFDSSAYKLDPSWSRSFLSTLKPFKINKEYVVFKQVLTALNNKKIPLYPPTISNSKNKRFDANGKIMISVILSAGHFGNLDMVLTRLEGQTFSNFEVLVLFDDDLGSPVISQRTNLQIRLLKTDQHLPQTIFTEARGSFLFIFNQKWLIYPDCLKAHYDYLKNRNNVYCLASLGITNSNKVINEFTLPSIIKISLLKENNHAQGPVLIRKSALLKHNVMIDSDSFANENYKLLATISHYGKIAILEQVLFTNGDRDNAFQYPDLLNHTRQLQLAQIDIVHSDEDLALHLNVMSGKLLSKKEIQQYICWSNGILDQNEKKRIFNHRELYNFLRKNILNAFPKSGFERDI